ncbi:MAG: YkgJ family cysteine cluster protein [Promethearchaeota archaeon]
MTSVICRKKCQAKCCKSLAPVISSSEINRISKHIGHNNFYDECSSLGEQCFSIKKQKKTGNNCYFLDNQNLCSIYPLRPLDCQLFPFFTDVEVLDTELWKLVWYYQECPLSYHILKNKDLPTIRKTFLTHLKSSVRDVWEYHIGIKITGAIEGKIKIFSELINLKEIV